MPDPILLTRLAEGRRGGRFSGAPSRAAAGRRPLGADRLAEAGRHVRAGDEGGSGREAFGVLLGVAMVAPDSMVIQPFMAFQVVSVIPTRAPIMVPIANSRQGQLYRP